jgi:hypothetical protein
LLDLLRGQQPAFAKELPEIRNRDAHGTVVFLESGRAESADRAAAGAWNEAEESLYLV